MILNSPDQLKLHLHSSTALIFCCVIIEDSMKVHKRFVIFMAVKVLTVPLCFKESGTEHEK
jgi:hypothetical protein